MDEDVNLGRLFDLATFNKTNVNGLNIYEIRKKY